MKILINTITQNDIANMEAEGVKDLPELTPTINGEVFPPGEWKHVPDEFVLDSKAYPFIKDAELVLKERTAQAIQERGLDRFSQALEESYVLYSKTVPTIAVDVAKYATVEAVAVEEVSEEEIKP